MSLVISQGTRYTQLPDAARTIMVRLSKSDFYNPTTGLPQPNSIPLPDDFNSNILEANFENPITEYFKGYLGAQSSISLGPEMQKMGMDSLASVYIDNCLGTGVLLLRHRSTGLQIVAGPFTQGHYPILLPGGSDFTFDVVYVDAPTIIDTQSQFSWSTYPDVSAGRGAGGLWIGLPVESGFLRLQFTNVIVPPCQWSTRNDRSGIWYDYSRNLPSGSPEVVLEDNPFRKAWLIQNASADPLFIHPNYFGADPNSGITLEPGQMYVERGWPLHTRQIMVEVIEDDGLVVVKEMQ